ncbi:MAG: UvrD-helicase domain-containing protein [Halothermotrichaceae bacterium]
MLLRVIKRMLCLSTKKEREYIEKQIKKYSDLFYNSGNYRLNRKQCEAVVKNKRFNQVIAAAGTGKTTVLLYRIKYLIQEGINPDRIIAITYSKKAANEMSVRLENQFNLTDVEVRTVHSFANKIIRNKFSKRLYITASNEAKTIISRELNKLIRTDNVFLDYFIKYYKLEYKGYTICYDKNKFLNKIQGIKHNILDKFLSFIDLAKKNNIKTDEIKELLNKSNKRQYYFGLCAEMLYKEYQSYLTKNNKIDFNDMLFMAADIIKKCPAKYYSMYDHMLVDEFQDLSLGQIKFIKRFFPEESNTNLFCVGDDWQSIYSFQGAEPKYFLNFEKYFGRAAKSYLTENYRCPAAILNAGNQLILHNKNQIKKKVKANKKGNSLPVLHILKNGLNYKDYLSRYTMALVQKMLRGGCRPADIMILCRYDSAVPFLDKVKKLLKRSQIPYIGKDNDYYNPGYKHKKTENAVSIFSVHQAKGCEADNVILLHVVAEDSYSFPAPERETELVEPVKTNKAGHLQEERRLFYVAITRTGKNLHILTQANNISPFIKEIESYLKVKTAGKKLDDTGDYVSVKAKVYKLWKDHSVKIKQVGLVKDQRGNIIKFLSWRNSKAPVLEKNMWYIFKNIKVSTFNNKKQLIITDNTEVSVL